MSLSLNILLQLVLASAGIICVGLAHVLATYGYWPLTILFDAAGLAYIYSAGMLGGRLEHPHDSI